MDKKAILAVVDICNSQQSNNLKVDTAIAWVRCLQKGDSPIKHLRMLGIENIIIYGIAELGELLVEQTLIEKYNVVGISDKKIQFGGTRYQDISILSRNELKNYRDTWIVVTSMTFWEEIKNELEEDGCEKVISLYELVT